MISRYKHVRDCLEAARNGRFCAGAEKAATEIKRLQSREEILLKGIAKSLVRTEDPLKHLLDALAALKE